MGDNMSEEMSVAVMMRVDQPTEAWRWSEVGEQSCSRRSERTCGVRTLESAKDSVFRVSL